MNNVGIVSFETSQFHRNADVSIFDLACQPCIDIFKKNDLRKDIDAVLVSSCSQEQYMSSIISEMLGIRPKISHRIDNLCNSGTNAIISAFSYISSGLCESALVVGVDIAPSPGGRLVWDITRGYFSFPVHWAAMFAHAHMRRYGTTREQMALVSVKNRRNASKNPQALFKEEISVEQVLHSKAIAEPLGLLDCSCLCNGSSAVLLVSEEKSKQMQICENPVWIKGIGQQTNYASFSNIASDLCSIETSKAAAAQAYKMADINPGQIDVAEVHDAFSIMEILAYEDLGFAGKGKGGLFVLEDGGPAVNTRGGILGCGHPVGATGIAQVVEIASQLAGKAGKRQVENCKNGLVQNIAAAGSSSSVILLGS